MNKPFSYKTLTRILVILILILSIATGYFQASLIAEQKKYLRLEDRYVRVRSGLGTEETQRLIDESRQVNN
ncbi:MAG: hypothetical protein COZ34_05350 [Candidatus Pacebacteria bacterium CG_4_10_14_3_um_filter_34_15]|nr:hypothetical protein [Candidatus Pacearchaeota archaeon]NCQ65769.1 hypothetical protein [Candidatus Paceibacterota bacterium]OIO44142.1 MAG: hypothetical protein AUJ41_03740 [Candidatus Pacebacteria bacterium CG1_02_43_31]PIQ81126.1 MAG: hypothetical protein COV78_01990 [Candidatus Pacebacteria bacterium CG11_big_fil_rev_8_21_14_0_20_34_55]PIX81056.1 MAG: hypothetical protein COZ34_05350 [Candidatus Pacebacteria bacterium CG_4_10_14_3_um_filter_34_15]PJC44145.1 MAG: hypothetical protein CO0